MTDVREKFVTSPLDLVIRVRDTFGEVRCPDLANDPLVTFFLAIFAEEHQRRWAEQTSNCFEFDRIGLERDSNECAG